MEQEYRSAYAKTTWRSCCLAPAIAVAIVLLLTIVAGLFSPPPREAPPSESTPSMARRRAFVRFAKQYFATAQEAENLNEKAFTELENLSRKRSSPAGVKVAFHRAADANRLAAARYRSLTVPSVLLAREECQEAVKAMSEAFDARCSACEILVRWADDRQNQTLAREYARQVEAVNRLTVSALKSLGAAADANGITEEDVREFLPARGGRKATEFRAIPMPDSLGREPEDNR